ncbi:MAG: FAD-dependent oxidoreductase [Kiritimatiellae bacterium]|nr:FAD-dependent oxidoreductase [Kiritimatiellia bacterium]
MARPLVRAIAGGATGGDAMEYGRRPRIVRALVRAGAVAAAICAPAIERTDIVWLEAERFQDIGGWTIDAQFRQLMGSTYLIAAGTGEPVADAVTRIRIPTAGRWRLWVRCLDWDATSPGRFRVWVGERPSPTIFGTQRRPWGWVDGGEFDLPAGETTIRLRDLTGYYGRCDALMVCRDLAFAPPDGGEALARLREFCTGPYPVTTQRADFVVIGGGYGGVAAAVQAARLGLRTVLVQNRPVLGGNASREIRVGPGGAASHVLPFREPGICEEIAEGFHRAGGDWSAAMDRIVAATSNLTVLLDTEGDRAVMDGRRIVAVEAEDVVTGARYRLEAPLFADCTGDGTIAFSAGCTFRHGEEARSEYGESRAPEQATRHTMGTSILHHAIRMPDPQPYSPPPFAVKFSAEHFVQRRHNLVQGTWWIEYGGLRDTIAEAEEIRDELLRVIFGAFDWAKNHDPEHRDRNTHYRLAPVPIVAGKRESRRFLGDYVLTQQDVEGGRIFEDAVAYGGWPIDIHPPEGIYGKEIPPAIFTRLKQPYTIPYRCLYAKDVHNLLLAGRHISVTHVALGSTRLMQTIGLMGQAVGAAAALCHRDRVGPRGLHPHRIRELQRLLVKWDSWIPGIPDDDPANLCRGARVLASSEQAEDFEVLEIPDADPKPAPMTVDRAMEIATASSGVRRIVLRLSAEVPVVAALELSCTGSPPMVTSTAVTNRDFRWVAFELPQALEPHVSYRLQLRAARGLSWCLTDRTRGRRWYGRPGEWTEAVGSYLVRPVGIPHRMRGGGAAAAVDGWGVPEGDQLHQWRSDRRALLPQWLEVEFPRPVELNVVHLTWDTDIFGRFPSPEPRAAATAKEYRVLAEVGGGQWRELVHETENWRRFRRHAFAPVIARRLRVEVAAARGAPQARLYEIRAYRE